MRDGRLSDLEQKPRLLSHNEEAIQEVQRFSSLLAETKERLSMWNTRNAILRRPIETGEVAALGFYTSDDAFTMLQGDVIRTEAAYFLGERVTGHVGWRIFASFTRTVTARANPREVQIRSAIEGQLAAADQPTAAARRL